MKITKIYFPQVTAIKLEEEGMANLGPRIRVVLEEFDEGRITMEEALSWILKIIEGHD